MVYWIVFSGTRCTDTSRRESSSVDGRISRRPGNIEPASRSARAGKERAVHTAGASRPSSFSPPEEMEQSSGGSLRPVAGQRWFWRTLCVRRPYKGRERTGRGRAHNQKSSPRTRENRTTIHRGGKLKCC